LYIFGTFILIMKGVFWFIMMMRDVYMVEQTKSCKYVFSVHYFTNLETQTASN